RAWITAWEPPRRFVAEVAAEGRPTFATEWLGAGRAGGPRVVRALHNGRRVRRPPGRLAALPVQPAPVPDPLPRPALRLGAGQRYGRRPGGAGLRRAGPAPPAAPPGQRARTR